MFMSNEMYADKLGIIHALAAHLAQGGQTDEVADHNIFAGMINVIVAKMEIVIDENFGGDTTAFHTRLLQVIFTAAFEGDDPVKAIDNWLGIEWKESAKLYN
jgi:hypothetical protein